MKRKDSTWELAATLIGGIMLVIGGVFLVVGLVALNGAIIYAAWNWVLAPMLGMQAILFWQACILGLVLSLLKPTVTDNVKR